MSEESKPKKKEKIIGIDLGTSNSACAILSGTGQPEIVPAAEGRTLGGKAFFTLLKEKWELRIKQKLKLEANGKSFPQRKLAR
jgi:molecular chaperone DnaK (HSP70)